jgi:hypothetical protein
MSEKFNLVKVLGAKYYLRCVLFHHISDRPSPFTEGLDVSMGSNDFAARIRFLAKYYTPIDLSTFLAATRGTDLPPRPILVTFDDAYASVAEVAVPICRKYNVPVCFFVNASFVGNRDLSIDNFVCYVANTFGFKEINVVAREINGPLKAELRSRGQVTAEFIAALSTEQREAFKRRLAAAVGVSIEKLANDAKLYLSSEQLREMASSGVELGNHTFTHVHGRVLAGIDFSSEIEQNKFTLERISSTKVRAFSLPYGSVVDFTPTLEAYLRNSGHEAAFLVESRKNTDATDLYHLNRVCLGTSTSQTARATSTLLGSTPAASFVEIEMLPRLRSIRDAVIGSRESGLDAKTSAPATVKNPR